MANDSIRKEMSTSTLRPVSRSSSGNQAIADGTRPNPDAASAAAAVVSNIELLDDQPAAISRLPNSMVF